MEISDEEKHILLECARNSLTAYFKNIPARGFNYDAYPILKTPQGVFVTLKIFGQLRGCVGYIASESPLYFTVFDAARSAAFHDERFFPLQEDELEELEIEISVLSCPEPMTDYNEIMIGKHGLILEDLNRRALLLPQVPVEHNLNKDEYLSILCEKAGLNRNTWKTKKLNLFLFTAVVFSEEEERKNRYANN